MLWHQTLSLKFLCWAWRNTRHRTLLQGRCSEWCGEFQKKKDLQVLSPLAGRRKEEREIGGLGKQRTRVRRAKKKREWFVSGCRSLCPWRSQQRLSLSIIQFTHPWPYIFFNNLTHGRSSPWVSSYFQWQQGRPAHVNVLTSELTPPTAYYHLSFLRIGPLTAPRALSGWYRRHHIWLPVTAPDKLPRDRHIQTFMLMFSVDFILRQVGSLSAVQLENSDKLIVYSITRKYILPLLPVEGQSICLDADIKRFVLLTAEPGTLFSDLGVIFKMKKQT